MDILSGYYAIDLETTTQADDCHIWAWSGYDIYGDCSEWGTTFDGILEYIYQRSGTFYFHNLRFDGEFMVIQLLANGWKWIDVEAEEDKMKKAGIRKARYQLQDHEFSTLISADRKWYAINIACKYGTNKILDSFKIIPSSISKIAKDFGLKEKKGEIDYNLPRPLGYVPASEEIEYVLNDTIIQGKALKVLLDSGLKKMTAGANALHNLKTEFIGLEKFNELFPDLSYYDEVLRKAYKGGWTYLNPRFKNRGVGPGIVIDANSMYPYVMHTNYYPYGEPKYYNGKYRYDKSYPLYIQEISCNFEIKPEKLPTIQIKGSGYFTETEYLESSYNEELGVDVLTTLTLTNVDLKLFLEHYNVTNLVYIRGWKFHAKKDIFTKFVDYWYDKKREASETGNKVLRILVKLILNSCYGKFATRIQVSSSRPVLTEDGSLALYKQPKRTRQPVYLPVGIWVTSYARNKIIRAAQSVYHRFIYADTDSLHLLGSDFPPELEIDNFKLGAWKHESTFIQARFLRQKCYFECEVSNDLRTNVQHIFSLYPHPVPSFLYKAKITVAGMPDEAKQGLTFDKFWYGYCAPGKKKPLHVPGGVILVDTTYTLKPG